MHKRKCLHLICIMEVWTQITREKEENRKKWEGKEKLSHRINAKIIFPSVKTTYDLDIFHRLEVTKNNIKSNDFKLV